MRKRESIQALRGIAFLLIFLTHAGLLHQGSTGVSIFFVLSGFLLYLRHGDERMPASLPESLKFSFRHIKKLYPLHLIMTATALPFLYKAMTGDMNRILKRLLVNILLIQSWFPRESIRYSMNNLSWFLSVMMFAYACFPIIRQVLDRRMSSKRLMLWVVLIAFMQFVTGFVLNSFRINGIIGQDTVRGLSYNFPLFRLGDFIIGCLVGKLFLQKGREIQWGTGIETLGILFFLISVMIRGVLSTPQNNWWSLTLLHLFPSCCLVWLFFDPRGRITKAFSRSDALIYLGNRGGELYLIHEMLIRYLRILFPTMYQTVLPKLIMAIVALGLSILCTEIWIRLMKSFSAAPVSEK